MTKGWTGHYSLKQSRVSLLVYLAGSCMARYGAILQAKLTLSFHCFSLRLMYLDLQLKMLVSTDCSVAMASSCVDSGLYQVVSRSISLACQESAEMLKTQESIGLTGTRLGNLPVKPTVTSCASCSTCATGSLGCFFWTCL